jgi:hypothetical protein
MMAISVARGSGVTPWTLLSAAHRYWSRFYDGSALALFKLGPKEARLAAQSMSLARYEYWRLSLRGIITEVCSPFCRTLFVKELPAPAPDAVQYRLSWV